MSLLCPYYVLIISLLCPYYVLIMSLLYPYYILIMSLLCPYYVLIMSLLCPYYILIMSLLYPYYVLIMSLSCTVLTSEARRKDMAQYFPPTATICNVYSSITIYLSILYSSIYLSLSAVVWRMSRLTRDGTAEPVSRDQTLRHVWGQGNISFPCSADHEQDLQPYPVDPYFAICDDHTYTYIHVSMYLVLVPFIQRRHAAIS